MTLTAIVGAFLAVVARPARDERDVKIVELKAEVERLDRELALERSLVVHWKEQAMHMARLGREAREQREALRHELEMRVWGEGQARNGRNAFAQAMACSQQAQQNMQMAQQAQLQSLGLQQQAQQQLAFGMQQQSAFGGFCNCVPSRSQVWHEEQAQQAMHQIARRLDDQP